MHAYKTSYEQCKFSFKAPKESKGWEVFKSKITDICIEDKLIVLHKWFGGLNSVEG